MDFYKNPNMDTKTLNSKYLGYIYIYVYCMLHKTSVSPTVIHGFFHLFSTLSLSKINMNLSQKNEKKKERNDD